MSKRQVLFAYLICLFMAGLVFAALPISHAQGKAIFGYPYETSQGGGSGAQYDAYGSRFTLNGDANINSISGLMDGGFNPTSPSDHYIYRFAIYHDDSGKVGSLIAQTEICTFTGETGTFLGTTSYSQNAWSSASFAQPVHLGSGNYWLIAVHNATNYLGLHDEVPAATYTTVTCVIGGMDFPPSLNSPIYTEDYVLCLYASGEGPDSVSPPLANYTHQLVSRLSVGCTTNPANNIEITGNLTTNRVGIASAPILLSYAENVNATWQRIDTVNTGTDGAFSATWNPTITGSYVINATYPGDSTHMPVNTIVNVIVTSAASGEVHTVFSVDSNSTVTDLGFNSETAQLSFSVRGESGTIGYAEIYVAKSLVGDASQIKASIDGAAANFTVSSTGESWVLYFSYHHSSHTVVFSLNGAISPVATPNVPELMLPIVLLVIAGATALVGIAELKKEHKKSELTYNSVS
jgi:hypothetical protein